MSITNQSCKILLGIVLFSLTSFFHCLRMSNKTFEKNHPVKPEIINQYEEPNDREVAEFLVMIYDEDKDGLLSKTEFENLIGSLSEGESINLYENELQKAFEALDINQDGLIDVNELSNFMNLDEVFD